MQTYSDPSRANDKWSLPDVEVFHVTEAETDTDDAFHSEEDGSYFGDGWYFWYCFPGCLPEGDPWGPYTTEAEAMKEMRERAECF